LFKELWGHRFLLVTLIRRNFVLRYRQTAAGFAWSIVPSLALLAMATFVFGKVAGVETGGIPYPVFAIAGLAPWTFFTNCLTAGVPSVVQSSQMITRLSFPRAVAPLSMLGVSFVDLLMSNVVLFAIFIITGTPFHATIVWFPVLLFIELLLAAGVVLLGSAMNVFMRDLKLALPLVMQLWLFLTPVMYPLSEVDDFRAFFMLNPMTGLIESMRDVLLYGNAPAFDLIAPTLIGAGLLLVVGTWYFSAIETRFADAL
jgi:lipopolysaccharide transport system permease protein